MRRNMFGWVLLALVVGSWVVWLRPPALGGGTSLIVVSGSSMEPALMPGDLILTRDTNDYRVGDVAVYTIPDGQPGEGSDAMIVHRLTGGSAVSGFETQGDNRPAADPWTPRENDIVGSVWLHLPGGGNALLWLLQPAVIAGIAGAVAVFLVLGREEDRTPAPRPQASRTAST